MKRLILALPLIAAACTTAPPRVAAPPPVTHIAPPMPPALPADWRDRPYSPGAWHYADRTASFGPPAAPSLTVRCDPARRIVLLSVAGSAPTLTIRTSYAQRDWPAQVGPDGRSVVSFAATDPTLDQIVFSRGRFSVSAPTIPEIDIPAWAEPARVVEDCRG